MRGGSFYDAAYGCRAAGRYPFPPNWSFHNVGFRVAADLPVAPLPPDVGKGGPGTSGAKGSGHPQSPSTQASTPPVERRSIAGIWKVDCPNGIVATWTIRQDNGRWSVNGIYTKGPDHAGSFKGQDCEYGDGTLRFRQLWDKKPDPNWHNAFNTVQLENGRLKYSWTYLDKDGIGYLDRADK
jgi:hypothetical protein